MLPLQPFYHFVPCTLSYLFAEIKLTLLKLSPGILGFTSPKLPSHDTSPRSLTDCSCHKTRCNHTEETRRRRHVVMINQSKVRQTEQNWCRPTWDKAELCLQSELGKPSGASPDPDRLTNQCCMSPHQPISIFSAGRVIVYNCLWQNPARIPQASVDPFFSERCTRICSLFDFFSFFVFLASTTGSAQLVQLTNTHTSCTNTLCFPPQVITRLVKK